MCKLQEIYTSRWYCFWHCLFPRLSPSTSSPSPPPPPPPPPPHISPGHAKLYSKFCFRSLRPFSARRFPLFQMFTAPIPHPYFNVAFPSHSILYTEKEIFMQVPVRLRKLKNISKLWKRKVIASWHPRKPRVPGKGKERKREKKERERERGGEGEAAGKENGTVSLFPPLTLLVSSDDGVFLARALVSDLCLQILFV